MRMNQLLELYPTAEKKEFPSSDDDILSLAVEDHFLWIHKSVLSSQESALLKALFSETNNQQQHPWYGHLFDHSSCIMDESYRMIQLHIESKGEFLKNEWQKTMLEIFPDAADFFFYTKNDALLVEQQSSSFLDSKELSGIFLSLDADFDTTTQAFVGSFHSPGQDLTTLFAEERKIFLAEQQNMYTHGRTFSMTEIALHYYTKESIKENALISSYQERLADAEMDEIILELWKNLGNISSTAKTLFLHRNTLKYRIEKFQEQTGLNLKQADDLLFCYLLLLHR
ncbi:MULTISPECIES: helix-turn-helix domain-containing protein [unclassified Enterococcus]|uniref:helix-turn-helix domain-containing protein n=1 Tax=unclassified Enterococcus TaxID=2608891 RepID=UPI0013EAE976|nr:MULTISPECIES: helix-turn-helix domain-containing protein [unclassified Enterococcus]